MKMKMLASKLARHLLTVAAIATFVAAMGGTWTAASAAPPALAAATAPAGTHATSPLPGDGEGHAAKKSSHKEMTGKINLNTATEDQLMLLPSVGPAKAERIVAWRKKNGAFKRVADLRHVKGFGYKSFKRLEPFLDIKGETTLEAK
jgi:competence protein ComEA